MAFLAQLTAQTEELVTAVTGVSDQNDSRKFGALRDAALRSLRHHSFGRTNQFEVESRLDGLEERFAVAGRDELSEALQQRRVRLAAHATKWTPDILDLLLALSDRPVDKASLDELNRLSAPRDAPQGPAWRWEDIAKEDGWANEPPLWQSARYSASDDDGDYDDDDMDADADPDTDKDDGSADTTLSSVDADYPQRTARDLVLDSRSKEDLAALLQAVRDSQSWWIRPQMPVVDSRRTETAVEPVRISELHMLRETLYMLRGLDTTLFGSQCVPVTTFQLSDVSPEMHRSLVESVARSGRRLLPLYGRVNRSSSGRRETVPLLQVFEDGIRQRLLAFHQELCQIEARHAALREDVVVSLAAVMDELQPSLACLSALAAVVEQLAAERNARAFRYLEMLFDAASAAQLEGQQRLCAFLGTLFFECFQVYLRPIRLWMEDGQLLEGDKIFFVAGAASDQVPLHQIWQRRFKLLRTSSGALHAPRFLQPAASRIFTTGKSIVVLKHLGRYEKYDAAAEPPLDYDAVCPPGTELAPFAQLFEDAFERWIQSKHHAASATLQATFFHACGLGASLRAQQRVFLMADGAAADAFASRLFHGLDTRSGRWHDCHILTEVMREALGGSLDARRLSAAVEAGDGKDANDAKMARRSVRNGVARVKLSYRLPWPVQIIIPGDSIASYQALFTLLLQVRRASSVLGQHRLRNDHAAESDGSRLPTGERALYFALRARLVWFCTTLQSYLTTLVIAPHAETIQADLQRAVDVDAMIEVHAQCLKALLDEACLGPKLQPIHAGLLDLLDLALRLEDARRASAARESAELQETWRLSVLSSPYQTPTKKMAALVAAGSARRQLFKGEDSQARARADHEKTHRDHDESDDSDGSDDGNERPISADRPTQTYGEALRHMRADFESNLRFVASGLRGVARASSNAAAASKWDLLAEMLEAGR